MKQLPFTGNPDTDSLFVQALKVLPSQGVGLSRDILACLYVSAHEHFLHAFNTFGNFCHQFAPDEKIDLRDPAKSFLPLVLQKVPMKPEDAPWETRLRIFSMLPSAILPEVAVAMSHFFNEMIRYMRLVSTPS